MILSDTIRGTGLVADYLRYVGPHEAPQSMHLACLMTLFTSVIERRMFIARGYNIRANLYVLLVGPPATRKGWAMRTAKGIFKEAGWEPWYFGDNLTTESLVWDFQEKEKAGESPAGLVFAEELGRLIGDKKYQLGLIDMLLRAFDCGPLTNGRKGGKDAEGTYSCGDSWTSLLAATTPEALRRLPSELTGEGMISRVWFVTAPGKERSTWRPAFDPALRRDIIGQLKERLAVLTSKPVIRFDIGKEADAWFTAWYEGPHAAAEQRADPLTAHWFGRRHDHAVKAAVLLHLLDGGDTYGLTVEGAQRGVAFIEAMEPGMFEAAGAVGATEWSRLKTWALEMARASGPMTIRAFKAKVGQKCRKGEVGKVLEELLEDRMLVPEGGKVQVRQ